jgi:hypothetical protein
MPFPEFLSIQLLFNCCLSHELSVKLEIIDLLIILLLSLTRNRAIFNDFPVLVGIRDENARMHFLGKVDMGNIQCCLPSFCSR